MIGSARIHVIAESMTEIIKLIKINNLRTWNFYLECTS